MTPPTFPGTLFAGRRRRRTTLAGITVAGVAAAGLAVPALADDSRPSAPVSTTASTTGSLGTSEGLGGPHEELRDRWQRELAERLADELGLDPEEVAAALETVTDELRAEHEARLRDLRAEQEARRLEQLAARLDRAVERGRLTQEQADRLLEAARERDGWPGRGLGWGHGRHPGPFGGGPGHHPHDHGDHWDAPGQDDSPDEPGDGSADPSST